MGIEVLIYCYGAISLSMILFNCFCIIAFKKRDDNIDKNSDSFNNETAIQISLLKSGEALQPQHLDYLSKKLVKSKNLMAFDVSLDRLFRENKEAADNYLYEISSVFAYLAIKYCDRENVQSAYFAYFLAKYRICRYSNRDMFMDILMDYLKKDSLYCKMNVMKVLYSCGTEESVIEGIAILDSQNAFFHSKILTDGLLTFQGDHKRLIELFWQSLNKFTIQTQVSILNYIRFKSGDYCEEMFAILTNENYDCELHFAAIRYFGKYKYEPARSVCLAFADDPDEARWNYAAFSASSLANYPGEDTVQVLKKGLYSSNWYMRYNSAQSLEALGLTYNDLIDVVNGNDRYAREMIIYRFDNRNLKQKNETERVYAGV